MRRCRILLGDQKAKKSVFGLGGVHFFGPPSTAPPEYYWRIANHKRLDFTPATDPKNRWGLHNEEIASVHPSFSGLGRHNFGLYDTRGGTICEIPPVPVYRTYIWCTGECDGRSHHPRIFIKCLPGQTVVCKWCRLKYINLATKDDNDDNWRADCHRIQTTPEKMEDLCAPRRTRDGVLLESNFQDGRKPEPDVYPSVFDPERYQWVVKNRKRVPPSSKKIESGLDKKAKTLPES